LTQPSTQPVIHHIPEYHPDDTLNNRLAALVRLEQFLDEKTMTSEILAELQTIARYAKEQGERRISTLAELIIQQTRTYLPTPGRLRLTLNAADFRLLETLRQTALEVNQSGPLASTRFLHDLRRMAGEPHPPIIKAFIGSLLKSHRERADFSGVFDYRRL